MGSLMAGWDSNLADPNGVKFRRNQSLTREEIDTYWKLKKQTPDEQTKLVSEETATDRSFTRSSSAPPFKRFSNMETDENEGGLRKMILKNGWWMSSNSAFLNEPPASEEDPKNKYKFASQFHVTKTDASEPHHGISTS